MNDKRVTIFGGSGFVGRHVVQVLARKGWRIRVAARRPDRAVHLQPLGTVGQIACVQANVRYRESVARALDGCDAAVNLIGILSERGRQRFSSIHVEGAQTIAEECRDRRITNVVHVSAITAAHNSPSVYGRSKRAGEERVLGAVPHAVVMRPSLIFGPDDDFFNRFAAMARLSPALPLIGGGKTRFQPIYAGDLALAIARALEGEARVGTIYEIGGDSVHSFRQLMQMMLHIIGRERVLLSIPFFLARPMASLVQFLPGSPLTPDQVASLEQDSVVSPQAVDEYRTLADLDIVPRAMESILPEYLSRFRKTGEFEASKPI